MTRPPFRILAIASSDGLFQPIHASAYSMSRVRIDLKKVRDADVPLATSQILARNAKPVLAKSYDLIRTADPPAWSIVARTYVSQV